MTVNPVALGSCGRHVLQACRLPLWMGAASHADSGYRQPLDLLATLSLSPGDT